MVLVEYCQDDSSHLHLLRMYLIQNFLYSINVVVILLSCLFVQNDAKKNI